MSQLTTSARTILRRLPMTLFIAGSVWYIAGGAQGLRHVGTRIRQWFAPTQQELQVQRAQVSPLPVLNVPIRTRELQQAMLTEPLPIADQILIVSAIIVIAIGFMYFTGRGS
jgi:hypothetical protein